MKQKINPPGTEQYYDEWQMSQGIRVGATVWLSGKTGNDPDGNFPAGLVEQTRLAFQRIETDLIEAGGTLDDIVELVTYHASMADLDVFRKVKSEFIRRDFPAWTAVGVTELYAPEALVEIKATAVIGSGG